MPIVKTREMPQEQQYENSRARNEERVTSVPLPPSPAVLTRDILKICRVSAARVCPIVITDELISKPYKTNVSAFCIEQFHYISTVEGARVRDEFQRY